jgi:O-antigen ligase
LLIGAVKKQWQKALLLFAFVAILLGLWTTETRGAWMGAICGLVVIAAYYGPRAAASIILALLVLIGAAAKLDPNIARRLKTGIDINSEATMSRVTIWRANIEIFKDYPLLGIGYNENERLVDGYYKRMNVNGQVGHAHNNYLQYLSGTGIVGFICYLFFVIMTYLIAHQLWWAIPKENVWDRGLVLSIIGAQVANAVGGLTECNFKDAEVRHLFLFLLMGLAAIYWKYVKERQFPFLKISK